MIRAIFWDNDGVLVDTEALFFAANRKVLAERGIDLGRDDSKEMSPGQGRSIPERGDYAPIRGLVVISSSIGGAENAACLAYPPRCHCDSWPRQNYSRGLLR